MRTTSSEIVAFAAGLMIAGCGDNHTNMPPADAEVEHIFSDARGECWPVNMVTPAGSATIGTGYDSYVQMPDPLPIEYGAQDGFDLVANVMMTGLKPGDPTSILNYSNPLTRIRAFFADTNIPLNYFAKCPFRVGYSPTGDGSFVMSSGQGIIFETCWRAQHLIGKQVRIELELVDYDGNYTTAQRTVTLAPPVSGIYPMEGPLPGCTH